jgi:hypothetical protein
LPGEVKKSRNKNSGFSVVGITMDGNVPDNSQKLIMYTSSFDEVWNPIKIGKQLPMTVALEEITMKKAMVSALVDSGCTRTCTDEEFMRNQG